MGKRGPKPKGKVKIEWSANFAYAIGLIATDACLYKHRPQINFTSKDIEQIKNFQHALGLSVHIGRKSRGSNKNKDYYVMQFQDKSFYDFLNDIGITSAKSRTINILKIPDLYFFDFVRGAFDGDGYSSSYFDKRWRSSFLFYLGFCCASLDHILWLRKRLLFLLGVKGHISMLGKRNCYQLRYAKREAVLVVKKMYKDPKSIHLSRKKLKIDSVLSIIAEQEESKLLS